MGKRNNYYGDVFGRFLEAAAAKEGTKIETPKEPTPAPKVEVPQRSLVRTASRSWWMDHLSKVAQAGGIADQIAASIMSSRPNTPAGQGPVSEWDVKQAIQKFMTESAVGMPPGTDMNTLSQSIMSAIQGKGGKTTLAPDNTWGGTSKAPMDPEMRAWKEKQQAPAAPAAPAPMAQAPAAPAAPAAAPRQMPRKPFEGPPAPKAMPRRPFEQ